MKHIKRIALLAGVSVAALLLTLMLYHRTPNPDEYETTIDYQIQAGDTLWNIAKSECFETVEIEQEYDIRDVIRQIAEMNDINETIRPGQWITLPYYTK